MKKQKFESRSSVKKINFVWGHWTFTMNFRNNCGGESILFHLFPDNFPRNLWVHETDLTSSAGIKLNGPLQDDWKSCKYSLPKMYGQSCTRLSESIEKHLNVFRWNKDGILNLVQRCTEASKSTLNYPTYPKHFRCGSDQDIQRAKIAYTLHCRQNILLYFLVCVAAKFCKTYQCFSQCFLIQRYHSFRKVTVNFWVFSFIFMGTRSEIASHDITNHTISDSPVLLLLKIAVLCWNCANSEQNHTDNPH